MSLSGGRPSLCVSGCGCDCGCVYLYLLNYALCIRAKSLQSYPTICNPMDCSLPGSSIHGILQTRIPGELPFSPLGDIPNPWMESRSLRSLALADWFLPLIPPGRSIQVKTNHTQWTSTEIYADGEIFYRLCAVLSCSVVSGSFPARLLCPWGFSRQGYWNGLPWPPPGDLPNTGIEPRSPASQADSFLSHQRSPL